MLFFQPGIKNGSEKTNMPIFQVFQATNYLNILDSEKHSEHYNEC